jgi:hypothetical protein
VFVNVGVTLKRQRNEARKLAGLADDTLAQLNNKAQRKDFRTIGYNKAKASVITISCSILVSLISFDFVVYCFKK